MAARTSWTASKTISSTSRYWWWNSRYCSFQFTWEVYKTSRSHTRWTGAGTLDRASASKVSMHQSCQVKVRSRSVKMISWSVIAPLRKTRKSFRYSQYCSRGNQVSINCPSTKSFSERSAIIQRLRKRGLRLSWKALGCDLQRTGHIDFLKLCAWA